VNTFTGSMRQPIDRAQRAWQASPLAGYVDWWLGELRGFLPARLRAFVFAGPRWYLLERQRRGWSLRRSGETVRIGDVDDASSDPIQLDSLRAAMRDCDPADIRIALCLPASMVLRRRLLLPTAARNNLRQVAGYEMDRQTPFRIEQVHYGARDIPGPAPAGMFAAELAVLPRNALDPMLARIAEIGLAIDAVDVVEGHGRLGLNLLPPALAPVRPNRRRHTNLILAAALVLLAWSSMAMWLHNRETVLAHMQAQVDSMHADAQRVGALRKRLADSQGAAGFLLQRKKASASASVLALLDELTRKLPDDTTIERMSFDREGQVNLQGQSQKASRLIDLLKDSATIRDPGFQGTIQTDPATGKDRFFLMAHMRNAAGEVSHAHEAR
jgi:general secretion pathway protein L